MAISKDDMRINYPFPVYNYRVEVGGEIISFAQVSGLNMTRETTTYKESPGAGGPPGPVIMRMPAQRGDVTITLQKGLVRQKSISALYDWYNSAQINLIDKKDIRIDLCDEEGDPIISWKVINAFPTSLEAPTFDANSNDAAIENMQLTADLITMEEN